MEVDYGFPDQGPTHQPKKSQQWYINFPSAVAQAMEFNQGETVEWFIDNKETLVLHRPEAPERKVKKTLQAPSSRKSKRSSEPAATPSGKSAPGREVDGSS